MTLDRTFDGRHHLRVSCFAQEQATRRTRQHESNNGKHEADDYRSKSVPISSGLTANLILSQEESCERDHDADQRG